MSADRDLEKSLLQSVGLLFLVGIAVVIMIWIGAGVLNKQTTDCEDRGGIMVKTSRGYQCFDKGALCQQPQTK